MELLDAGEQGEREWCVVTARRVDRLSPLGTSFEFTSEANVIVRASSMEIVDGALVFRTPTGDLSWAFGPGGWLEVSRA